MKKVFMFGAIALLAGSLSAKEVTTCSSYFVSATNEMDCSGHFSGKATMLTLYAQGWRYIGDVGGVANKFVLVFEK